MDPSACLRLAQELLNRPYPAKRTAPADGGDSGPGYHVVNLRVSDDFWDDVDGTAARAAWTGFDTHRRELAARLAASWGAPERINLLADLGRSSRDEPLAPLR